MPMTIEPVHFVAAAAVGVGATAFLDLWAALLKLAFHAHPANYCLVGRWLCHMPGGTFRHPDIATSPQKRGECAVGWSAHYVIGAAFAVGLVLIESPEWLRQPTLLPALLFGVATLVAPFLILQPGLGLGIAASKTPNPSQARLRSLMMHAMFGVGLYVAAMILRPFIAYYG